MVDFRKKLGKKEIEKKVNPIEIYDSLDRKSETGPLRPAQQFILENWFNEKQNDKNLIIKLHTGQGKTLIGLLILLSKLNNGNGPCLYICPNIYLSWQTVEEAKKFGIPYCVVGKDGEIPDEFLNGEKILITYVQKVFNGKTKFGLDNNSIKVNNIILDDSHACIDSLKSSFTIRIKKEEELFNKFISLFENDLEGQGAGSFLDIRNGKSDTILPVPYWSWDKKKHEVLKLLSEEQNNTSITFAWPLMRDNLENFRALVSGQYIELTPYHIPIHHFGSFNNANQRILMSATTQDDSFFIKGLGFDLDSISNPLIDPNQKWSGEKMLILPSLIDDTLDRDAIVESMAIPFKKKVGIVSLVPSFRMAEQYKNLGSVIVDGDSIYGVIQSLKQGSYEETVVIVNRYDGIDLPDNSCRVLIFDSKPFFISLSDIYEESCRRTSDVINIKIAQKIEQGLGRSVRGEKDYSVILLIGGDLVKFIKSNTTNKYFSPQTRQQILIGLDIAKAAKEDLQTEDSRDNVINSLIKQSIERDSGWKEFYRQKMDEVELNTQKNELLELFQLESQAEFYQYNGDSNKAIEIMQKIIDNHCKDKSEVGWYQQILARYYYNVSEVDSNRIQINAFKNNYQLIHPKDGITYKKIVSIDESRLNRISKYLKGYLNHDELMLSIDNIVALLNFGTPAEKFESIMHELGTALGFKSQRPDKEYKKGPDNLWCGGDKYILFECKSEVLDTRNEIYKHEAGQMTSHCAWFDKVYSEKKVKNILIIPTKTLSNQGIFGYPVEIMRKNTLKKLRDNVKKFFKEFKKYDIQSVSEDKIQELINNYELTIDDLMTKYSEPYYHSKS